MTVGDATGNAPDGTVTGRRMTLVVIMLAIVAALGGGLWWWLGRGIEVRIPQRQLEAALAQRLPQAQRLLGLFELTFDRPRVTLGGASQQMRIALDLSVTSLVGSAGRSWPGAVELRAGLRYEPGEGALYLADPAIEDLSIASLSERQRNAVRGALTLALRAWFARHPVYVLDGDEARQGAARRLLRRLTIGDGVLVLSVGR